MRPALPSRRETPPQLPVTPRNAAAAAVAPRNASAVAPRNAAAAAVAPRNAAAAAGHAEKRCSLVAARGANGKDPGEAVRLYEARARN